MKWFLGITFLFFLAIATYAYHFFSYTSDGFHYYSALRNICEGTGSFGLWEGPVFEHLLGNHFFFTLYVFLPLVWIFKTPLVLLYGGIALHFLAAAIFAKILARVGYDRHLQFLWVGLFLLFGAGWQFALGSRSLFIPEVFLPPCIFLMVWSLLQKKSTGYWVGWIFILLSKEEFLLTGLSVFGWIAVMDRYYFKSGWFQNRRFWQKNLGVYLGVAAFVIMTFLHYKGLNTRNHADRPFKYWLLLEKGAWEELPLIVAQFGLPLLGIIGLILGLPRERWIWGLVFLVFVVLRALGNVTVYSFVERINHWSYLITAAPLLVTSAYVVKNQARRRLITALGFGILFAVYFTKGSFTIGRIRDLVQGQAYVQATDPLRLVYREEVPTLAPQVRPPVMSSELIALPERTMAPFMRRSHVSLDWLLTSEGLRDFAIWGKVSYLLLPKDQGLRKYEHDFIYAHYRNIAESPHFYLMKQL